MNSEKIQLLLKDLQKEILSKAGDAISRLSREAFDWKIKYNNVIRNPCEHKHFSLTKDDSGTHFVCSCCERVMQSKKSAQAYILDEG